MRVPTSRVSLRARVIVMALASTFGLISFFEVAKAQQPRPVMSADDLVRAFSTQGSQSSSANADTERTRSMRTRGNSNFATQKLDSVVNVAPPSSPPVSLNTITFEFNSAELTGQGRDQLDKVAEAHLKMVEAQRNARQAARSTATRSYGQKPLQLPVACESYSLVGHTDLVGTYERNDVLSDRRAQSAAAYLRTKGVVIRDTAGLGKRQPVVNDEGPNELNRRVEITCHQTTTAQAR